MSEEKRVLVVDDEEIVRLCCLRSLVKSGFNVEVASDAAEALGRLRDRKYDIIVSDLKMPNMDGIEFINLVSTLQPGARMLLITGYAMEDVKEKAEAMGAGYLEKPFSPEGLIKAIKALGGVQE